MRPRGGAWLTKSELTSKFSGKINEDKLSSYGSNDFVDKDDVVKNTTVVKITLNISYGKKAITQTTTEGYVYSIGTTDNHSLFNNRYTTSKIPSSNGTITLNNKETITIETTFQPNNICMICKNDTKYWGKSDILSYVIRGEQIDDNIMNIVEYSTNANITLESHDTTID